MLAGHIRKCGKELGRSISFPFSRKDVLNLVGYFLQKGLKVETISNYLASVRAAHIYRGVEYPDLRAEMVEAVLSGARNRDLGESREPRLAMTPGLMRIFKDRLKLEKMRNLDKRLVWAIATMAFWGSLHIHEICATSAKEFSATDTIPWGL